MPPFLGMVFHCLNMSNQVKKFWSWTFDSSDLFINLDKETAAHFLNNNYNS